MKTRQLRLPQLFYLFLLGAVLSFSSCTKDEAAPDPNPIANPEPEPEPEVNSDLAAINSLISGLSYDPEDLLNVQGNTGTVTTPKKPSRDIDKGAVTECRDTDYDIKSNFESVVMFDPTLGVVYPGALIMANRQLYEGAPLPLQIPRAPTKLRVDLPGIGDGGNTIIAEPTYQNTQAGIDNVLEYWNSEIQPQGYEIDAEYKSKTTTAYTKEQMSLDLGVSAEWSKGSFDAQFDYSKTTEKRVATRLFRQVFYSVVMESPESPASVFGSDVSLATIESAISSESPPAYVSSVQYGRIIMVRMETTDTETEVNLEAALDYKTAKVDAAGEIDVNFEKVIKESTISIMALGGNAEIATKVITGSDIKEGKGGLWEAIDEGALYSRSNPGAPIGYTVKYLKDNQIAKMGDNTKYRLRTCDASFPYEHKSINAKRTANNSFRYRFSYFEQGNDEQKFSDWKKLDDKNVDYSLSPEDGSYNVKVQFQVLDLFVWKTLGEFNVGYVSKNKNYEAYCAKRSLGVCTQVAVKEL
ncbi:thiol-activated cytolysin family protein [Maribacter chungangensis]|uniref:Thiol-activated cytolysin family protein n=1 Tax=Maribacter chungangensis TaxID=1069117 RepID=A0ABW3B385_9FLAO